MRVVLLLVLLCTTQIAYAERSAATLLRVTIDDQIADAQTTQSFEFETVLIEALRNAGLDNIDLTPLHSDFQKLRYGADLCAVVDGQSSADDCAQFGNYAEAVIDVLANIREARSARLLNELQDDDLIIIMNAAVYSVPQRRSVGVDLFYRVYRPNQNRSVAEGKEDQERQMSARMTKAGTIDRIMEKVLKLAVASITQKSP